MKTQFTIRRLMVLTALVAVFMAWIRPDRLRTYNHHTAHNFYWTADVFPMVWPRRIHIIRQNDLTRPSGMIYGVYFETE